MDLNGEFYFVASCGKLDEVIIGTLQREPEDDSVEALRNGYTASWLFNLIR